LREPTSPEIGIFIQRILKMDVKATKLELIEMLLRTEEESVLKKIKEILDAVPFKDSELTEDVYKIFDQRRERHFSGNSDSFSWEEVKEDARRSVK
jgi:hypothetical protein